VHEAVLHQLLRGEFHPYDETALTAFLTEIDDSRSLLQSPAASPRGAFAAIMLGSTGRAVQFDVQEERYA
jgi:hypothetical protein